MAGSIICKGLAQDGQKVIPYHQNNQSKKGWGYGSSGRVPALQVQYPVPQKYMHAYIDKYILDQLSSAQQLKRMLS
jgi:hypothetical protein